MENVITAKEARKLFNGGLLERNKKKYLTPYKGRGSSSNAAKAKTKKQTKPITKKPSNRFTKPTFLKSDKVIFIGVDPSGKKIEFNKNGSLKRGNIGICIAASQKEVIELTTENFFSFMTLTADRVKAYKMRGYNRIIAVVEQPDGQGSFDRDSVNSILKYGKQNRDLGKNQFASSLIATHLKLIGCEVYEVTPKQKGQKWGNGKKDDYKLYRSLSSYKGKIFAYQEHAIDGYQLACMAMPNSSEFNSKIAKWKLDQKLAKTKAKYTKTK